MKHSRKTAVLLDVLRQLRLTLILFAVLSAVILVIFSLYGLRLEPFGYAFAVSVFLLLVLFGVRAYREAARAAQRQAKKSGILSEWNDLPEPRSLAEADYGDMIRALGAELDRRATDLAAERKETQDFYTAWVHQIKTPIAVMKLALGGDAEPDRRALSEELFRMEEYTNMVLAYQRLGSTTNDLVIGEYALDELIREVIRKFASQFIAKKLRLDYAGCGERILTDKKWFVCILEQLVSNALKYTPSGSIRITAEDGVLTVADTGIGIAPEDLPRIFERGYTGVNGRLSDKSSGLGLYLCGEAAKLLNLPVSAESVPGEGSRFSIDIREKLADRT